MVEDILPKFVLNTTGFSSFGSFMKILTVSSSLLQFCPGTGIEVLCQTVPATPSSLEKHQEPHSHQWVRLIIGSVAPDLECGEPG